METIMRRADETLWGWAESMATAVAWPGRREQLAANLEPMIRRALRSGAGLPGLVSWVRRQLPDAAGEGSESQPDPERTAPDLAWRLSATILEKSRYRTALAGEY
jgi:hypothetical protein